MNISYDKIADALYFYFQKGKKIARTVELADLLIADLDRKGKVIGLEVLCASRQVRKDAPKALHRKLKLSPALFNIQVPLPIAA